MQLTYLKIAFLLALFSSTVLSFMPLVVRLSRALDAVSLPLPSAPQNRPIPCLGGLSIAGGFLVGMTAVCWTIPLGPSPYVRRIILGALVILGLGILDDLFGYSAWPKLMVEALVATYVVYGGVLGVDALGSLLPGFPWLATTLLGPLLVFWIVGITNAYNLTDGLDGLTSGLSTITVTTLGFLAFSEGDPVLGFFFWGMACCGLGFLLFNSYPASVFLGDSGSLFIGFLVGAGSIQFLKIYPSIWAVVVVILVVGVPFFDTAFTVCRRIFQRRSLFTRDHGHLHHLILRSVNDYPWAVFSLYVLQVITALVGFVLWRHTNTYEPFVLLSVLLLALGIIVNHSSEESDRTVEFSEPSTVHSRLSDLCTTLQDALNRVRRFAILGHKDRQDAADRGGR